jgi:predicted RNA-binding protein YlxR (DUF448 family)
MPVPIRSCAGCGRKAPKTELLRYVAVAGELKLAPAAPGRGVYTCRRLSCFERALSLRAFNRALKTKVQVDSALRYLYTD